MHKKLTNYAAQIGLPLTQAQGEKLLAYARCVWDKKDVLNLTSAATFDEVVGRHICDGLTAAAEMQKHFPVQTALQLADMGAGCGYIGMTLAVALPQAHVTLVESLEKRCKFMNWAGQGTHFAFDVVTERAMGQLPDIFAICMDAVKPGGIFMAFQGAHPQEVTGHAPLVQQKYTLPGDNTPRYLVLFKKSYA